MAAWQCINHIGGTLYVSRLKTVRVNSSADRDATVNQEKLPCCCPTTLANGGSSLFPTCKCCPPCRYFNLVFLNVLTSGKDTVFKTIIPHLTCTMKQTFKACVESNPEELAAISSINSINLSLLHQFQLVLTISAVSGRAATSVLAKKNFFWSETPPPSLPV